MQSLIDALKSVSANLSYPGELERLIYKAEVEVGAVMARLEAAEATLLALAPQSQAEVSDTPASNQAAAVQQGATAAASAAGSAAWVAPIPTQPAAA